MLRSSAREKRIHSASLVLALFFCLSALGLSVLMPRLGFEVGVQPAPTGSSVVVKRVYSAEDLQTGDIIEAVDGTSVHSRAAFYQKILRTEGDIDLTLRRIASRYQRPVTSQETAHGVLPSGLHPGDRPVMIVDNHGEYNSLENVELGDLGAIIDNQGGVAQVVFRQQQNEIINAMIPRQSAFGRTMGSSLIFLLIALMGVVAWRSRWAKDSGNAAWSNAILGLGAVAVMTLGLWPLLINIPIVFLFGIIGLTLFKVVDLDYHLVHFRKSRKELWSRIAIYVGPVVSLIVPVWLCVSEIPTMWGAEINSDIEIKLDTFVFLPILWGALYTLIDGGIAFARRSKFHPIDIQPYEIGLAVSCILAVFVFALLRIDMMGAQWFLMAAIVIQAVCNTIPAFWKQKQMAAPVRLDNETFSATPVREILKKVTEMVGGYWDVQVVIDRPSPKHVVALSSSIQNEDPYGLELEVLPGTWRDFLEVLRIEGSVITGEGSSTDSHDPVQGIAEKLGIVMALPITDNAAGTLTSLTLIVSGPQSENSQHSRTFYLSPDQRVELTDLIEDLAFCAPAMVYLSAEMGLEAVGDELDEILEPTHKTASFAGASRNPTLPLAAREIPHGLFDEDDPDPDSSPVMASESSALAGADTKVYEDEVLLLKSQMQALFSQQVREYALPEIELTESQKEALDDLEELDPPILFVGEPSTGKKLLALTAHQNRSEGPFLSADAAATPESLFSLDVFGDGDAPGLLQGAVGGSLFIENIDRLSMELITEIFEAIEAQPIKDRIALYLSVPIRPVDLQIEKYRNDPSVLPRKIQRIADACDAEIVVLEPLRSQKDILSVAEFYLHKEATRTNRQAERFSADAQNALKAYTWPGNFGELHAVIERAVMKCESSEIQREDLGRDFEELSDEEDTQARIQEMTADIEKLRKQVEQYKSRNRELEEIAAAVSSIEAHPEEEFSLDGTFAEIEKRLLSKLLEKYQNDPERAAEALGLNRSRFFNKLSKYQLINWS